MFAGPSRPPNLARFNFLSPHARRFWGNWERADDGTVAMLRTEAGRDPHDRGLTGLVGELSTRNDEFRVRWGAHDVQLHRSWLKHIRHPVVGELHLSYEVMELSADPGLPWSPSAPKQAHPPTTPSGFSPAGLPPTSQPTPWPR